MTQNTTPELYYLTDDGTTPNSHLPVVVYRQVTTLRGEKAAEYLEATFLKNGWFNAWRNGIYTFHHYHSNAHEVLGIWNGRVLAQIGGPNGPEILLEEGDVIIIPAGVGHKNCSSHDLRVIGAYPKGAAPDLFKPTEAVYKKALQNLSSLAKPELDPVLGHLGGICELW
jgi:uncharacterized protein YjlB